MEVHLLVAKKKKIQTLTGVIWLIGIVRRLGTQLASSLCPKPSVPINQMTPAFNIWGLPNHYISRTIVVNCSSPKLQSWYDFISERLCRPLVTPLYSLQPYLEATTSDNGSYNYTGFKPKLPTDPFLEEEEEEEKFETNKEKDFSFSLPSSCEGYPPVCQPKFNKTYCCRSLAAADCHAVIGALLCSVEHYEELITVERLEYEGRSMLVKGQADREQEYQCSAYYSLDHCTHPLSLVVMLGLQ
ncbi:hypothetical protein TYRP_010216 [Tyrophagus putrescentiae]|nr:hypothetical protein TYRP_010216 [Tyrophagus putrescentiae]